jgi:hypothetical protein
MKPKLYFSLIFIALQFAICPAFDTIDDPIMIQIVSGQYGHAQSEFMLYSSVFYGKVLVFLYSLVPQFHWYYFIFLLSHLASWLVILHIITNKVSSKKFAISLFSVLFLTFGLYFLGNMQFTTTSFLLGFSGFLLIINSKNRKLILAGLLMIIFASLIRFYSVLLLCWLLMPYMFFRWVLKDGLKNMLHYKYQIVLVFLLAIVLIFVRETGRNQYLKDEHASKLGNFIIERGKLIDNPNFIYSEENRAVFDNIGWTEQDFKMFFDYYMDPSEPFTANNLKYISENLHIAKPDSSRINGGLHKLFGQYHLYILIVLLIFCIIMIKRLKQTDIIFAALQSASILVFLSYLVVFNDYKPRVIIILFYLASVFTIFHLLKNLDIEKLNNHKKYVYATVFVIMLIGIGFNAAEIIERNENHKQIVRQAELVNDIEKDWLVVHGYDLPVHHQKLKLINRKPLLDGKVYFTMPAFLNHYLTGSKFEIEHKSIFELLCRKDENVLLLHKENVLSIEEYRLSFNTISKTIRLNK